MQESILRTTSQITAAGGGGIPRHAYATGKKDKEAIADASQPKVARAERYRDLTCPRRFNQATGRYEEHRVCALTFNTAKQYGLGVALYFAFVRKMTYMFLLMALLAIPAVLLNCSGDDWTDDAYLGLERTTLGNLGPLTAAHNVTFHNGYDKRDVGAIKTGFDVLICCENLVCLHRLHAQHRRRARLYREAQLTASFSAIEVRNFPAGIAQGSENVAQELAEFFEQRYGGQVVNVVLHHDNMHIVRLYTRRTELMQQIVRAEMSGHTARAGKLKVRLTKLMHKLAAQEREHAPRRRITAAYVTFMHHEAMQKVVRAYRHTWLGRCCCYDKALRFRGAKLHVHQAPEPSNILFQNLNVSRCNKRCRRVLTLCMSVAFLSITLGVVYAAQYYQRELPQTKECPDAVSREEAESDAAKRACFCADLSLGSLLLDESELCDSYLRDATIAKLFILATSVCVVLVNFVLRFVVRCLSRCEKHHSLSSQQRNVTRSMFIGLFLNTGVVLLLVNADLTKYIGSRFGIGFALRTFCVFSFLLSSSLSSPSSSS
jgi:hypothetical protein